MLSIFSFGYLKKHLDDVRSYDFKLQIASWVLIFEPHSN